MAKAHAGSFTGALGFPLAIDYQDILFPLEKHRWSNRGHSPSIEVCGSELDDKFGMVLTFNSARTNGMGAIALDQTKSINLYKPFFTNSGTINVVQGSMTAPFRPLNANGLIIAKHTALTNDSYCGMQDESGVQIFNGSTSKLPISAGQPITFSIWAKGDKGGETAEIMIFDYPGDTAYYGGYAPQNAMITLTNYWKKYSITQTAARANSTRCWGRVDVEQSGAVVYWTAPQIEAKAYATAFVPGAQSGNSSLTYPNFPFPTQAFTVNCWVRLHGKMTGGAYQPVFEMNNGGHQRQRVLFMFSNDLQQINYWSSDANSEISGGYSYNFVPGNWYMLSFSFNGSRYRMYINGNLVTESASTIIPSFQSGAALSIGGRHWGTLEGAMADFLVSPREWNPSEIEAVYDSGTRLVDPYNYIETRWYL